MLMSTAKALKTQNNGITDDTYTGPDEIVIGE